MFLLRKVRLNASLPFAAADTNCYWRPLCWRYKKIFAHLLVHNPFCSAIRIFKQHMCCTGHSVAFGSRSFLHEDIGAYGGNEGGGA